MANEDYSERIRAVCRNSRSYHDLCSLVEGLRTKEDTQRFMESYMEIMKEVTQDKLGKGEDIVFGEHWARLRGVGWSLESAAKHLAADNLSFLANVYEACTDRKPQRSWHRVLEQVCAA